MKTFKFNLDFIEELYAHGLVFTASELFQFMSDELKKGNIVILVRNAKKNQSTKEHTIKGPVALEEFHESIKRLSIFQGECTDG